MDAVLALVSQLLQGDMGYSMLYNTPVSQVIADRLAPSLALLLSAWLFSGAMGFCLGLVAGRYLNRWPDKVISTLSYLLASIPVFGLAYFLLSLLLFHYSGRQFVALGR